jgi:hypothetical protein
MANDAYSSVNGVRNTLVNEPLGLPVSDNTSNSIFIFGTAPSGPLYTPTKVSTDNVNDIFGEFVLNQYSDRSLLKAYYEAVAAGGTNDEFDVRLVRVGNVGNAAATLYEMNAFDSGVHAPTGFSQSIRLTSNASGREGNGNSVTVTGTSGIPEVLTINTITGQSKSFYLDPVNEQPGYISNVFDLLEAINGDPDIQSAGITATTVLVESEINFPFVAGSGTIVDLSATGNTYGNQLVEIANAYSLSTNVDTMEAGLTTLVLSEVPNKTLDENVQTLSKFEVVKTSELVLEVSSVTQSELGASAVQLKYKSDTFWTGNTDDVTISALQIVRGGVPIVFDVDDLTFDVDKNVVLPDNGAFTQTEGLVLGDRVIATYKYTVQYIERKYKSQLISGNRGNYFVSGDSVIFGAPQSDRIAITYSGKQEYLWGTDIALYSRSQSKIQFMNPQNMPVDGDTIYLTLRYLPELPAPTGTSFSNGTVQVSSFSGGEDGISMSLAEYKKEVKKGLDLTFGHPCAAVVVAGSYLDDTITGYNAETGMKEQQNIGWHQMLIDHVLDKSNYVSECKAYIGTKILNSNSAVDQAAYIQKLITVSSTDTNRPANIVAGIDAYPLIVTANDFIVSVPKVSTSMYKTSPAMIYAVARQSQDMETSPIKISNGMPSCVRGLSITAVDHSSLNQINRMRYTFFIRDTVGQTNNIIPSDAPTMALTGSSLDRQYVLDIVYMCQRRLRAGLQHYLGLANDDRNRKSMENSAKSILKEFTPNFLSGFDVKISADAQDKIDGNCKIKYVLITSREIRKISQETRLKLV